jgi:transcription termination/antitermination protein NusA
MAELHGEKIDIVDYSDDPADFVANALSPARVTRVEVIDRDAMEARVTVPDYQLSLAIGKEGQNARLAARLTGWRIDIRSDGAVGASAPAPRASTPVSANPVSANPVSANTEAANAAGASADAS